MNYSLGDTLLKIDDVSVQYDDKVILRNVSADIKDILVPGVVKGQIVAILGPSGCGKTTLFRMMAGLEKPTSGKVLIGVKEVSPGEVGVVAQNYPLFFNRTVFGNLMLAARAHHPEQTAKDIVRSSLEQFGLADKVNLYPAKLSGGQRQRVAILQMLLCEEEVILLDEPFSGLDMIRLEQAMEAISHAANLKERNTFCIVTHDVSAAVSVADHIWLLGHEYAQGQQIPGSRIVENYDLLSRGLSYQPGILTSEAAMKTVKEIKERFRTL